MIAHKITALQRALVSYLMYAFASLKVCMFVLTGRFWYSLLRDLSKPNAHICAFTPASVSSILISRLRIPCLYIDKIYNAA